LEMKLIIGLAFLALAQCLTYNTTTSIDVRRRHITAMFGPQEYSVTGRVQVAAPSELCVVPTDVMYTTDMRIMFVRRGNCTFYQKAQNAMALGAAAVVIANAVVSGADEPFLLGYPPAFDPTAITIPVVSVSKAAFDELLKLNIDNNGSVSVSLNSRPGPPPPGGDDGDRHPPHRPSSSSSSTGANVPSSSSSSSSGAYFPDSTAMNGDMDDHPHDDDGAPPRRPHQPSGRWVFALGVAAVVATSCLCGFCIGRRCGAGRTCRRHQARAAVSHAAPVAPVTVHQGLGYTQVDMETAPAGYYGQEMMPMESTLPTPSAPAYAPSGPSSAEMRYA